MLNTCDFWGEYQKRDTSSFPVEPTRIKAEAGCHEGNVFVRMEPTHREWGRYMERQQILVALSVHLDLATPAVFYPLVFSV